MCHPGTSLWVRYVYMYVPNVVMSVYEAHFHQF